MVKRKSTGLCLETCIQSHRLNVQTDAPFQYKMHSLCILNSCLIKCATDVLFRMNQGCLDSSFRSCIVDLQEKGIPLFTCQAFSGPGLQVLLFFFYHLLGFVFLNARKLIPILLCQLSVYLKAHSAEC